MNPFEAFRSDSATRRATAGSHPGPTRPGAATAVAELPDAHRRRKQAIWVVEQGALSRAYSTAVEALKEIDFTVEDLRDMCLELDTNDGVTTPMGAPSGLFIAAMCNQVPAHEIALDLHLLRHRWPFLGYRLPRGRRLSLDGDAGDFVGALLDGGEVIVTGNAGNYTGIGMKTGTLQVGYSTGKYTGEGMRGGTLRVGGRIAALGRVKQGGARG